MLISLSKRFVFLANPKTGSVSVQRVLRPFSEVRSPPESLPAAERAASGLHNHISARKLLETFKARGWNWNEFHSFTMIRNPWRRIVSAYEYARKNPHSRNHERTSGTASFEDFLNERPIRPIENHAFDREGRQLVSEILRTEDLAEAFPELLRRLDLPAVELPWENRTAYRSFQEYYTGRTRELVETKYARDIALGGYTFDDA